MVSGRDTREGVSFCGGLIVIMAVGYGSANIKITGYVIEPRNEKQY